VGHCRDTSGCCDVDGLERVLATLEVEADGIDDCPGTADGSRHRGIVICVRTNHFDVRSLAGKQRAAAIGMPRRDPNGEIGIVQMTDNPAAEKAGAAEDRH
jgi:hypothetical protein